MGGEAKGYDGGGYFREDSSEGKHICQIGQRPEEVKKGGKFKEMNIHNFSF
jgi:hypothetical protein